jgi:salicylate hydroxylase
MTPWQGSGMGQAFEDAAVLGALCGRIRRRSDLKPAFKAFDAVRRPRNQRIVDSSTETGKIMCGIGSEVKMNVQDMRLALEKRWEFIIRFDLERHKQDALHMFADFSKADD